MPDPLNIDAVLAAYPVIGQPTAVRYLGGAGGFSGARFWRVETTGNAFCLRRWPAEYPRVDELEFMHKVLGHVRATGFEVAAVPLDSSSGVTYLPHSGHLWELAPWMPGEPDSSEQPSEMRVAAAMECLARFHRASEEFAWPRQATKGGACPTVGASLGIHRRRELLQAWLTGRAAQLEEVVGRGAGWPAMERRGERLLRCFPERAPAVARILAQSANCPVPLQPCIRDVWYDHLLFEGDQVTGLIDFGSMGVDNISCDVARLLGSLARGDRNLWQAGIRAYATIRPLSEAELGLVEAFDRSGVLLGALNWAAWVFLEGRVFEEPESVLGRMDALMARLESDTGSPPTERGLLL